MTELNQLSQIAQQIGNLAGEVINSNIKAQIRSTVNQRSINQLQTELLAVAAQTNDVQGQQELLRLKGLI